MLSKGDLVYVEGRLNYRKKSETQFFTEIVAKNIRILNRKNYSASDKAGEIETINIEDIGFPIFDENE